MAILLVLASAAIILHTLPLAAAEMKQAAREVDIQGLTGRWVRPDGGYILELRKFENASGQPLQVADRSGRVEAAYFNPNPIRVFRAEWRRKDERIDLYIELRDANYPGSIYRLSYDPKTDRLLGTYFQAVAQETYDVEFMRGK